MIIVILMIVFCNIQKQKLIKLNKKALVGLEPTIMLGVLTVMLTP